MRLHTQLLLGALLVAACGGDNAGPDKTRVGPGEHQAGDRAINGQILTAGPGPDSTYVGVAGAEIVLVQAPSNGGGIDSSLVDPATPGVLRHHGVVISGMDSSWVDTIPSDTSGHPPIDTSVDDPHPCGSGPTVATTTSDASGHFSFSGVEAAVYDIVVNPPAGFWSSLSCGADVRIHSSIDLQIYLAPTHGH